jgi:spoIIIJ-associated protein
MASIEVAGKNQDEARRIAAEKLGVEESALVVTVLEETKSKGLFGQSRVRIRAEVPTQEEAAPPQPTPAVAVEEAPETPVAEAKPASKGRGRGKKAEADPPKDAAPVSETPSTVAEVAPESEVIATQADADRLLAILIKLLESAELSATAAVTDLHGRYVTLALNGKDVSYLVGKHGEVLNAMQYLMNIIAGRTLDNGVRTIIDGADYRHKREEALVKLARGIAKEVKARGEEAVLDALPAFERRIVHKTLADIEGVTTYSEGEEPNRKVVIAPAD